MALTLGDVIYVLEDSFGIGRWKEYSTPDVVLLDDGEDLEDLRDIPEEFCGEMEVYTPGGGVVFLSAYDGELEMMFSNDPPGDEWDEEDPALAGYLC